MFGNLLKQPAHVASALDGQLRTRRQAVVTVGVDRAAGIASILGLCSWRRSWRRMGERTEQPSHSGDQQWSRGVHETRLLAQERHQ